MNEPVIKDKFIYIQNIDNVDLDGMEIPGEPHKIEIEFISDSNIWDIVRICRRMCLAIGYHPNTVLEAFPYDDREDEAFEVTMDELVDEFPDAFKHKKAKAPNPHIDSNFEINIENEIQRILNRKDDSEPTGSSNAQQ